MFYLKATKTSLYKLVQDKTQLILWINLPPMGKARFRKAFRHPDYFLEWYRDGCSCRAFLSVCGGSPLLSIECCQDGEEIHREVIKMTLEELRERGMVECVPVKEIDAGLSEGGTQHDE